MTQEDNRYYTISELAQEFDITTRTIRFYEEKGLITPERRGNARFYTRADRVRLKLILRGKRLGFSLQESREIIDLYEPEASNLKQMQTLVDKIRQRKAQLQQQIDDANALIMELESTEAHCLKVMHDDQ